jgi:Zn-dependent peptidase ImmA (M78 family)
MKTLVKTNELKYSSAELTAKRVLDECGLVDPTELSMEEIILGRKAFYEEKPLYGKEGEIVSVGNKSCITINSNIVYPTKKRFAAAHELGHYEMHRHLTPIIYDTEYDLVNWYQGGPQEMEANEFAAEFLMPTEIFQKECKGKKFSPAVIEHLANRFQVSKTSTILKFVNRGHHPVCIVYCKDNKMKWWKTSSDFRYFLEFKYNDPPPTGSVAYEMFTSTKFYAGDERKQEIWKSDWFRMGEREYKDSRFYEYCLNAKSYGYTISIIWED